MAPAYSHLLEGVGRWEQRPKRPRRRRPGSGRQSHDLGDRRDGGRTRETAAPEDGVVDELGRTRFPRSATRPRSSRCPTRSARRGHPHARRLIRPRCCAPGARSCLVTYPALRSVTTCPTSCPTSTPNHDSDTHLSLRDTSTATLAVGCRSLASVIGSGTCPRPFELACSCCRTCTHIARSLILAAPRA